MILSFPVLSSLPFLPSSSPTPRFTLFLLLFLLSFLCFVLFYTSLFYSFLLCWPFILLSISPFSFLTCPFSPSLFPPFSSLLTVFSSLLLHLPPSLSFSFWLLRSPVTQHVPDFDSSTGTAADCMRSRLYFQLEKGILCRKFVCVYNTLYSSIRLLFDFI